MAKVNRMAKKQKTGTLHHRLQSARTRLLKWAAAAGAAKAVCASTLVGVVFGGLGYWQFITPVTTAHAELRTNIAAARTENNRDREVERTHGEFIREFEKAIELYRTAQPLLPEAVEVSNVLAQVQTAAQRNGVVLTGFDATGKAAASAPPLSPPAGTSAAAPPPAWTMLKPSERIVPSRVVGAYPNVKNFFREVSRMPRIVTVKRFGINSLGGGAATAARVSSEATLVAYSAPPPASLPPLPAELQPMLLPGGGGSGSQAAPARFVAPPLPR